MATLQTANPNGLNQIKRPQHKRNKSSVLKALVAPKGHKRHASQEPARTNDDCVRVERGAAAGTAMATPIYRFRTDDSSMLQSAKIEATMTKSIVRNGIDLGSSGDVQAARVQAELVQSAAQSTDKNKRARKADGKKKSKDGVEIAVDATAEGDGSSKKRPAVNFLGLFNKTKSFTGVISGDSADASKRKAGGKAFAKDKENTTPPSSAKSSEPLHTPIYAQFATSPQKESFSEAKSAVPMKEYRFPAEYPAIYKFKDEDNIKEGRMTARPTNDRKAERPRSMQVVPTLSAVGDDKIPRKALQVNSGNSARPQLKERHTENGGEFGHAKVPNRRPVSITGGLKMSTPMGTDHMVAVSAKKSSSSGEPKNVEQKDEVSAEEINAAFEKVLDARNIPENMREKMRTLSLSIKSDFISKNGCERPLSSHSASPSDSRHKGSSHGSAATSKEDSPRKSGHRKNKKSVDSTASDKRSKTRSKTFTLGKVSSPIKKHKAERGEGGDPEALKFKEVKESSAAKTLHAFANGLDTLGQSLMQPALPEDFVAYLRKVQKPEAVEVAKVHKLRILVRNETVAWVNDFVKSGGMVEMVGLVLRVLKVEWREDHEDQLLHESLLCLKGLCTTDLAQEKLCEVEEQLFPVLLATLFDKEHKGPSEFTTRSIIINLLFAHLSSALWDKDVLAKRAQKILSYLHDPQPDQSSKPLEFIAEMQQPRPYRDWCREVTNVTKEVFWIFLHQLNVIPLDKEAIANYEKDKDNSTTTTATFDTEDETTNADNGPDKTDTSTTNKKKTNTSPYTLHFYPPPRAPVPAAPYVGGVEWDATNYLAAHLDLLNGLIAALPTSRERNALRTELRLSGFERVMGATLRTCKEKFYGSVHAGLKTWVAAAAADGWAAGDVRAGPKEDIVEAAAAVARKNGKKKKGGKVEEAPKLELKLDTGLGLDGGEGDCGKPDGGKGDGDGNGGGFELAGWVE